jgi:hypothetical protein
MDDLDELVISGVSKFPEVLPGNRRCCKMDDANLEAIRINTGLWSIVIASAAKQSRTAGA